MCGIAKAMPRYEARLFPQPVKSYPPEYPRHQDRSAAQSRKLQNCMVEICWYAWTILFRTCIIS